VNCCHPNQVKAIISTWTWPFIHCLLCLIVCAPCVNRISSGTCVLISWKERKRPDMFSNHTKLEASPTLTPGISNGSRGCEQWDPCCVLSLASWSRYTFRWTAQCHALLYAPKIPCAIEWKS
jgi:hypothetical protein